MDKISINFALCESKSLRNDKCQTFSDSSALEAVNKAKSLVMAVWKSQLVTTTKQLAEFYEVSEDVLRDNIRRHRDEFELDGLRVAKGKELKQLREILSLSQNSPNETIWTPRAALRLGMLLRDSEVAKQVRNIVLDVVEVVPQQRDRIRELELQVLLLDKQEKVLSRIQMLETISPGLAPLALGKPDAVVEKVEKVTETIVTNKYGTTTFEGKSTAQLGKELGFKTGAEFERWLKANGNEGLICQGLRAVQSSYVPTENIAKVRQLWSRQQARQLILGETN